MQNVKRSDDAVAYSSRLEFITSLACFEAIIYKLNFAITLSYHNYPIVDQGSE